MNAKCSFSDKLIFKNGVEKVEEQLADIKDEDEEEWDTLIFWKNTRRTFGLSESTWQTGCSTALNTAVIQNTWNTCFYLRSVSEQEDIFPFLFTCVWQLQHIHVSLWQHETSERMTAHETTTSKEGEVRLREKNNMLTNGFPKKALQYIRTCRWSQTRYTNRRVWSDSIFPGGFSD